MGFGELSPEQRELLREIFLSAARFPSIFFIVRPQYLLLYKVRSLDRKSTEFHVRDGTREHTGRGEKKRRRAYSVTRLLLCNTRSKSFTWENCKSSKVRSFSPSKVTPFIGRLVAMLSEGGEGFVSHDVAPAMYGTYAVSVLVLQKNYFEKSVSARAFFFPWYSTTTLLASEGLGPQEEDYWLVLEGKGKEGRVTGMVCTTIGSVAGLVLIWG